MADLKISETAAMSGLTGSELMAGVQSATNKYATLAQAKTFCLGTSYVDVIGHPMMAFDRGMSAAGGTPAFGVSGVMTVTDHKLAFMGFVWHPTVKTGTIKIRKVHFRCGAVSVNAASEIRVSLQDLSNTAGPPYQPDGTQDQFYDFKTATTTLIQNTWNTTGALSADRTIDLSVYDIGGTNPRRLAVVFEYQVFTAADSVIISNWSVTNQGLWGLGGAALLKASGGGAWGVIANRGDGIVALECDDGTYAFIAGHSPTSATSSAAVNSTGGIRRSGVKFKFPVSVKVDRLALYGSIPNGSDGTLVLYDSDGTTALRTFTLDNDDVFVGGTGTMLESLFAPVTLSANTFYRFVFAGSTATTATIFYQDVNAAGLMDGLIMGQSAYWTQYDGATWADTTTRRPWFSIGVCATPS